MHKALLGTGRANDKWKQNHSLIKLIEYNASMQEVHIFEKRRSGETVLSG